MSMVSHMYILLNQTDSYVNKMTLYSNVELHVWVSLSS